MKIKLAVATGIIFALLTARSEASLVPGDPVEIVCGSARGAQGQVTLTEVRPLANLYTVHVLAHRGNPAKTITYAGDSCIRKIIRETGRRPLSIWYNNAPYICIPQPTE